jgi:CBS domain containing-hemolysin-like protein
VDEGAQLQSAVDAMRERQCSTMPVMSAGRMIGLLTLENISEMLMVHAAMDRRGASQPPVIQSTPITQGSP